MVSCQACEITLPDGTVRCPMCGRFVLLSSVLMVVGGLLAVMLVFGLMAGSNRIRNRVMNWRMSSPEAVMQATQKLVAKNPGVRNPLRFSAIEQTTVEQWNAYRWRVAGFVDTQPEGRTRVRTLYFAVVQNSGSDWRLEDLQLQSLESR